MGRLALAVVLAMSSGVASAQAFNGATSIARGDLGTAEREIVAQQALYPDQVDAMINLATVYLRTGRVSDARRVWTAVASEPDQEVILSGGAPAWSHELADRALHSLPVQVAAR